MDAHDRAAGLEQSRPRREVDPVAVPRAVGARYAVEDRLTEPSPEDTEVGTEGKWEGTHTAKVPVGPPASLGRRGALATG